MDLDRRTCVGSTQDISDVADIFDTPVFQCRIESLDLSLGDKAVG